VSLALSRFCETGQLTAQSSIIPGEFSIDVTNAEMANTFVRLTENFTNSPPTHLPISDTSQGTKTSISSTHSDRLQLSYSGNIQLVFDRRKAGEHFFTLTAALMQIPHAFLVSEQAAFLWFAPRNCKHII